MALATSRAVPARFIGTLPVMYVFLARTGHNIKDVSLVYLDTNGELKSDDAGCPYWYAPEDAPKTCSVFPDTGAAIDTSTPD